VFVYVSIVLATSLGLLNNVVEVLHKLPALPYSRGEDLSEEELAALAHDYSVVESVARHLRFALPANSLVDLHYVLCEQLTTKLLDNSWKLCLLSESAYQSKLHVIRGALYNLRSQASAEARPKFYLEAGSAFIAVLERFVSSVFNICFFSLSFAVFKTSFYSRLSFAF